jgi:hypothetical protein
VPAGPPFAVRRSSLAVRRSSLAVWPLAVVGLCQLRRQPTRFRSMVRATVQLGRLIAPLGNAGLAGRATDSSCRRSCSPTFASAAPIVLRGCVDRAVTHRPPVSPAICAGGLCVSVADLQVFGTDLGSAEPLHAEVCPFGGASPARSTFPNGARRASTGGSVPGNDRACLRGHGARTVPPPGRWHAPCPPAPGCKRAD